MYGSEKKIHLSMRFIKSYKKNTAAVFFSFTLTFMLLTTILILVHTNFHISNIQAKTEFTPSDCYIDGLSEQQLALLREDPDIEWTAVQQGTRQLYEKNNQKVFLLKNDPAAITMMAKVTEGRLPEKEGEIAAEKWVLLNLGIEPSLDKMVEITDSDTGEIREFQLVGILSDIYGNKKYGLLDLYTPLQPTSTESLLVYIKFGEHVDYPEKVESLTSSLQIKSGQVKNCPAREDFRMLHILEAELVCMILLICMVVFYGIYRIAALSRRQQYGVLHGIGMKKRQLQRVILLELYGIYLASVPVGIGIGIMVSYFIMWISGDRDIEVYLHNEAVHFQLVIPVWQILGCVVITALLIGCIALAVCRKVLRPTVIDIISGASEAPKEIRDLLDIQKAGSKTGTLFRMACKYIFKDFKTSGFVVLTICVGICLFTGLVYKADTLELYRDDTKEMYYLNGQYAMTMQAFDRADQGISRECAEEILKIDEVASAKTSSSLPVRVLDEDHIKRNDSYLDEHNKKLEKYYGYSDAGYDGKDQIYKSMLCGYNKNALYAIKNYVIEGTFDPENMKEDEVILFVLSMDSTKNNDIPGFYNEGCPIMEYHAGDEIRIKRRKDLQTDSQQYKTLTDYSAEYVYQTFKIAAIVSFPYMYDCNKTTYPLLITDDTYVWQTAPDSGIQCMYVDGVKNLETSEQTELERKLIRIGSKNNNVSTRSLFSEIEQNNMFYYKQMIYIYGIAAVAFLLVIINMVNNLCYRMQTRTKEICMLRALGMSISMTKKMIMFENVALGFAGILLAFALSQPVFRYLYMVSDMRSFGHEFQFAYTDFALVSGCALLICILLSMGILKTWKSRHIIEGIGSFD